MCGKGSKAAQAAANSVDSHIQDDHLVTRGPMTDYLYALDHRSRVPDIHTIVFGLLYNLPASMGQGPAGKALPVHPRGNLCLNKTITSGPRASSALANLHLVDLTTEPGSSASFRTTKAPGTLGLVGLTTISVDQ